MRNISVILIIALIVTLLSSCSLRNGSNENGNDEMDPDGKQTPINTIIDDSGFDTETSLSNNPNASYESNPEQEYSFGAESTVVPGSDSIESNDNKEYISDENTDAFSDITDESCEQSTIEKVKETEPNVPEHIETDQLVETEPETVAYDGMEIIISDSSKLIKEAYNAVRFSGYSVAWDSARIIQIKKDNPNLIQVVFETDNVNIQIAVNYYRKNQNADWNLITGASFSIIENEENGN